MSRLSISNQITRIAMITLVTVATVANSGCRHNRCGLGFSSCLQRCFSEKGAKYRAADAWDQCPNRCASDHVRQGFIDGYVDVAMGNRGCTPAVAPSRYWGWRYSGIEGQQAGAQWLQGFPLGALAAQGEGASYRVAALEIPTEEEYRKASHNVPAPSQRKDFDPGPDTIDDTIQMPAYLDSPSDPYEPPVVDEDDLMEPPATEATDSLEKAVNEVLEKAEDAAQVPIEPTDQLKVQTVTASEGKSIKHLMTSDAKATAATVVNDVTAPARAALPVTKVEAAVKQKIVTQEIVKPKVVKEIVKEAFSDIPQLDLQQNDEVFGFGIE